LTENGYLRLDPFIIYHPIYEAGLYLAKQGKEECLICVAGLKQYSIPFPSVAILAEEIEVIYGSTISHSSSNQPTTENHIPSVSASNSTSTVPAPVAGHAGQVDQSASNLQNISWPTKSTQGMDMPVPMPMPIVPDLAHPAGLNRDFWPDGTPVPSRDVAWTLFDWLHQM
jgi:hypothetical protein